MLTLIALLSSVRPWRETCSAPWKNLVARLMLWRGTSDSFETFIGLLLDGIQRRDRESISMWRGLFQSAQSDPRKRGLSLFSRLSAMPEIVGVRADRLDDHRPEPKTRSAGDRAASAENLDGPF